MIELLRKKYTLTLETFKGREIQIHYEQGVLRELLSFISAMKENDIDSFLMPFLTSRGMTVQEYKNLDATEGAKAQICDILMQTWGEGFFSKSKGPKQKERPTYAMLGFVFKYTNETMDSVLNLTWKQISFLIEGAIYMLNEETKEGRQRNEQKARMDSYRQELSDEEALEMVRKLEEDIERRKQEKTRKNK